MKNNVSEDMGRKLVPHIGGRIVTLETCVVLIKKRGWHAEDVCEELFARVLNAQKSAIKLMLPVSTKILNTVASYGSIAPAKLLEEANPKLKEVLENLIDANVLRYTAKGHVTWHGRIQEHEFGTVTEVTE